jgi:glycosyltransferase involved in cell wall biosynthesis
VGDIAFADKCAGVIEGFRSNRDVTIVMVSHGLASVAQLCDRAAWIEGRTVKMIGKAQEVVAAYEAAHASSAGRLEAGAEAENADADAAYSSNGGDNGNGGSGGAWPAATTVRVVAPNVMPRDAVGDFAVRVAALYARNGIPARLYARASHPELAALVAPLDDLEAESKAADTLFYHFSTEDEFLPRILALPFARKILYYHNVTPGHWFRDTEPRVADLLDRAREQFSSFPAFDAVFANSSFSLKDIAPHIRKDAPAAVLPPTLCVGRLAGLRGQSPLKETDHRFILWVGRLAPHKRPELALELFARLCATFPDTGPDMGLNTEPDTRSDAGSDSGPNMGPESGPDVGLIMVGGGRRDFPAYAEKTEQRIAALPERVRSKIVLLENLDDARLAWLYRHCSLLLCTSGHEGCCLPLAEAMSFGLPVAAFAQEAVEETLNGYGTILPPKNPDEDLPEDLEEAAAVLRGLLERREKPGAVPPPPPSGEETARVLLRCLPGRAS